MDKFFNAVYIARKEIAWVLVLIMVGVIACCALTGCTKEDVDKYRDMTDTVIDLVDEIDELEKKIEDIIGEEAPCAPDEEASGIMMADPPSQGGYAAPPSSPNNIRRFDIQAVGNSAPVRIIIDPQGSVNPLNMPTYVEGLGIKPVSTNPPPVEVSPTPSVRPLPRPPSPPSPTPDMERPCLPCITPVSEIIGFPYVITEPIIVPTAYDWGDFEGTLLSPEFDTSPGCLFENACWNGCA